MSATLSAQAESSQTTRPPEAKVDKCSGPFRAGAWHERESKPLDAALAHLADRCPGLMPLARFVLPRVPRALLCSNTLKTARPSSCYLPLPKAVRRQWIGWNVREQERVNAIVIDCDKEGWRDCLRALLERGLPAPAYIAVSPAHLTIDQEGNILVHRAHETGHLCWFLAVPVRRCNARAHDLFRRTRGMLVRELGGDPAAAGHLTKNPFHHAYVTEVGRLEAVDLKDLYGPLQAWCGEGEYALPPRGWHPGKARAPRRPGVERVRPEPGADSRWGTLFEARHAVMAADARDYPTVLAIVEEHAAAHCRTATRQRIKDHARSIHRWMNTHWKGGRTREGIDHGAMTREAAGRGQAREWSDLDDTSKRILAAERTNGLRRDRTAGAVSAAALRLWNEGATLTQAAVAIAAGVSKREVERLWGESGTLSKVDTRSYQVFPPQGEPLGGGEGGTPPTLKHLAVMSRQRARAARVRMEEEARAAKDEAKRAAALVSRYEAHAAAMRERGAMPAPPPCLPLGTRGEDSPEVLAAYQVALDATADAGRRHEARARAKRQQEQAEERRANFAAWARERDTAAHREFMARQGRWWDHLVHGREGADLERLEAARRGAFARYWREWREALTAAGHPPPSRPTQAAVDSGMDGSPRQAPRTPGFRTAMDALDRRAAELPVPSNEDQAGAAQAKAPAEGGSPTQPLMTRGLVKPSFLSRPAAHVRSPVPVLEDDGMPF